MKTLLLLTISFFTFGLHAQLLTTSGNQWNIKHTSFNGWQDTYGVKIGEEEENLYQGAAERVVNQCGRGGC